MFNAGFSNLVTNEQLIGLFNQLPPQRQAEIKNYLGANSQASTPSQVLQDQKAKEYPLFMQAKEGKHAAAYLEAEFEKWYNDKYDIHPPPNNSELLKKFEVMENEIKRLKSQNENLSKIL